MKRLILIAFAGLLMTSAAPPPGSARGADGPDYPPCTAGRTDRCDQTYERDGSNRADRRGSERGAGGTELDSVVAAEAPRAAPAPAAARYRPAARVARASYPRCSATITDRCIQGHGTAAPSRRVETRRIQLAMRAGERG
jgi:hypothetical protein